MKRLLVFLLLMTVLSQVGSAQLPTCDKIYIKVSGTYNTRGIYTYDPTLPVSTTNPKFNTCSENPLIPKYAGLGLAISPHLGTNDSRLTFYSISFPTQTYSYYDIDSSKWINTGHYIGGYSFNIAAGGGYLFNTDINGNIYRYDGTGNGVFVTTISDAYLLGPLDLIADCQGNFYLLRLPTNNSSTSFFQKYSPTGILLQSWNITNPNNISIPNPTAGMAILSNQLYFDNRVTTTTSNMNFTTVGTTAISLDSSNSFPLVGDDDMASCSGFTLTLPTVTINANLNPVCKGKTTHFTATTTTAGTTPKFQWLLNGAKVGTDTSVFSFIPADGDTVRCRLNSSDYCASQVEATSSAIIVRVLPYSTPTVSLTASDTGTVCAGVPIVLSSNATNVGMLPTYEWYKNGIPIANAASNSYIVALPQNQDTFFVVVRSSAMCNTIDSTFSNKHGIRIGIPAPTVSLALLNSSPLCSGTLITIQANSSYPGNSPVYSWAINGIPWSGLSLSNGIFSNTFQNQDTVTVTMRSSVSCATPKAVSAPPLILNIFPTIVPGCNINITPGSAMCLGSPIHFVTNTVGGGITPNYQWLLNGTPWPPASGTNYTSTSLNNGDTISILFSSNEVCATPDTVLSNQVGLHLDSVVYPQVKIDSLINPQPDGSIQYSFFAHTLFGGPHPTFQWIKNGVKIAFARDSLYSSNSLKDGDEITVSMMSSENCPANVVVVAETLVIRSVLLVKHGQRSTKEIIILPNPNNGTFALYFDRLRRGRLLIKDAAGRLIYQQTVAGSGVQVRLPNEIGAGIHFVCFVAEDGDNWNGKVDVLR